MGGIIWFEHMYQPVWNYASYGAWNPLEMIEKCYKPNVELLNQFNIKMNMNILQTMYNFFKTNNALDILEQYRKLSYKIEFVGSTAHHLLCTKDYSSLLTDEIKEQEKFIKYYFNQSPKAFFPPELAIDETTERLVKNLGYELLLVSGGYPNFQSYDCTGTFKSQMSILPHNNLLSSQFSFPSKNDVNLVLEKLDKYEEPTLLAFDHESFGGYNNPNSLKLKEQFFTQAMERGHKFMHLKEVLNKKPLGPVTLKPTTWVGDYNKWTSMKDRIETVKTAMKLLNPENQYYIRETILPSCHLHADYATDQLWKYAEKIGIRRVGA